MLMSEEKATACKLYEEFWEIYPDVHDPSCIDTIEKAYFLILKGFESIRLMQKAKEQKPYFRREGLDKPLCRGG